MPADEYDPRPFLCKTCGWVLGESYREQGKRITQLRIFRHPHEQVWAVVAVTPLRIARPYAAIQVNDCTVICEHCGCEVGWYANQNAIEQMIERKKARIDGREKVT